MRKREIALTHIDIGLPIIPFEYKGKLYNALLDTGSEITLYHWDLFNDAEPADDMELFTLTGSTTKVAGKRKVQISLLDTSDETFAINTVGAVSDLSSISKYISDVYETDFEVSALIGVHTLRKYGSIIDLKNNKLYINDLPRKQQD